MFDNEKPRTVLVIAAHPDDEVLGCAGTIMKHVQSNDQVHVLFMTDGVSSRNDEASKIAAQNRREMAEAAKKIMGVSKNTYLDLPDNAMDTVPFIEIVKSIESKINEIKPSVIYTHFSGDLNIDHRFTHNAVMTACRPQPACSVNKILCFEVNSSSEWSLNSAFRPNVFVNIAELEDMKSAVLDAYSKELRDFPHTRSKKAIVARDRVRGTTVGVEAAESFILERAVF
jgi:N-acetylglucosamine malate deacetylase 1